MATQGIVSVLKEGKVVLKVICGSDGDNADKLANKIKELGRAPTKEETLEFAKNVHFGSPDNLVVMNEDSELYEGDEDLSPLYRKTFHDPKFNPRWECGLVGEDYLEIIEF